MTLNAVLLGENTFPFHRFDERASAIERALGDGVSVTATTDRSVLADLESAGYDVVIDYLTDSTLMDDEREGLVSFVTDGGGYLGIHCASDLTSTSDGEGGIDSLDEPIAALRELLGGHFLGHPEQSEFDVDILEDHPVTAGVEDFSVFDEPYQIEYDPDAISILARMDHPDEEMDDYPVVWVREHGDGRVCYSSLGHTLESLENESHRRILQNGLEWVTGN